MAKGICIVAVVLFHAHTYALSFGFEPLLTWPVIVFLQPIRMPLFFAVSGILAASALARPWSDLLARKVWPMVYLFALWGALRWVVFGHLIDNPREPLEGSDWTQLLTMWIDPSSALWYIWALALFCIAAKLLSRIKPVALVLAFALACLIWGSVLRLPATPYRLGVYLFFFLVGAWYGPTLLRVARLPWAIAGLALAAYLVVEFAALPNLERGMVYGILRTLQSVLGVALGAAVAVLIARVTMAGQGVGYLGRHTLPIYVTHPIVLIALLHLLQPLVGHETWRYLAVPLLTAAAIGLSLLLEAVAVRAGFPWLYRAPVLPSARRKPAPEAAG